MNIILNILTHGDERIGLKVASEIEKLHIEKDILTVTIANEKASQLRKRFVDQDLNQSFPGKKDGNYEERRAYALSPMIQEADVVIDIHSTKSELKDAVIVTKLDTATKKCIEAIQPKHVLVMHISKNTALISQANIGLAFEYGKDDNPVALENIVGDIKRLFQHLGVMKGCPPKKNTVTEYFDIVSEVVKPKGHALLKHIKNYTIVRKGEVFATNGERELVAEEDFYPILFGNKNYKDIFGFKGKKVKVR
ncbi:MAG: succinylglutamate desuccinylase/aspartoacylase family protein [Parcubacteria group bacterium]|nr:succinylglutamate desuccinylase/aspartoacylase family protein [Parcubacteria group bacterium]